MPDSQTPSQVVSPPRRRATLRTAGALGAAAALMLAGCSAGGGGVAATTSYAAATTEPSTASPSASATGGRITLGDVASVVVPAGWSHTDGTSVSADIDTPFHVACLDDPAVEAADGSCDVAISWGEVVAGAEGRAWVLNQVAGWNHHTDAGPCPVPGSTTDASATAYGVRAMGDPPAQSFAKLGPKTAYLDTYTATCGDGRTFAPRIWWLPTTHLMVEDVLGNAKTSEILASMTFTGTSAGSSSTGGSAAPGPLHGYLTAFTGGRASIDVVRTYGNDAAGKAYASSHGIAYPFDDDFLDVPTGVTRTAALSGSATCRGGVRVAGADPLSPKPVPCAAFGTYVASNSALLVDATVGSAGTITSIVEVYRP